MSAPRLLISARVKSFEESRGFYATIVERAKHAKRFNKRDVKIIAVAVEPILVETFSRRIAIGFVSFRAINLKQGMPA